MTHAKRQQAGYSLVELAIVVIVVGLMVSGLLVPLGNKYRTQLNDKAASAMNEAVEAIIGYAVTNRTRGALYLHGRHSVYRHYGLRKTSIPAGRPYLPCPDTTGDGIEDRSALQIPVVTTPLTYERNISLRHIYRDGRIVNPNSIATSRSMPIAVGRCLSPRGALPWRTLGLAQVDPWGNQYTYYVSDHFSTGIFGFDQLTRASNLYDLAEINFFPAGSSAVRASVLASSRRRIGAVYVCDPAIIGTDEVCTPDRDLNIANQAHTNRVSSLTANISRYAFPSARMAELGGAFDGLPFVIISHGPNGQGAMPKFFNPATTKCIGFAGLTRPTFRLNPEAMNAVLGMCGPTTSDVPAIADQMGLSTAVINLNAAANLSVTRPTQYTYIYARDRVNQVKHEQRLTSVVPSSRSDYDISLFDDSLAWLTRRELVQRMMEIGILPVEEPYRGLLSGFSFSR